MSVIKLNGPADEALSKLQNTQLSPMDEALFQAWAKANQIKKTDMPNDVVDYRGVYKLTGGSILPHGELKQIAARINDQHTLERALKERIDEHTQKAVDSVKGASDPMAEQQKHDRQMELEQQKQQSLPHQLEMKKHDANMKQQDIELKKLDLEKQKIAAQAGMQKNEGKKLDLLSSVVNPKPVGMQNATGQVNRFNDQSASQGIGGSSVS